MEAFSPKSAAAKTTPNRSAGGLPPFAGNRVGLPLSFMVLGLLALFTGMVWLVVRPAILSTYHYNQYVVAVTHLFVLGWICSVVMGAMYQLVPVALESKLYSERLARWQLFFHIVGFVGMVWMFWVWNLKQVGHFGAVFAVGVGLFVYNLARTLRAVPKWNVTASAVTAALGWITLTITAGLCIATAKSINELTYDLPAANLSAVGRAMQPIAEFMARFNASSAMHAHVHLGGVGFFLLLIVGVSFKLVPMFTLSEVQSRRRAALSVGLLNVGLAGSFLAILLQSWWKPAFTLLLMTALAIYGWELVAIVRARKRKALDWGIKYFLTATALLLPLAALGIVLSWPGLPMSQRSGQLENLYGFLGFVGVISLAIIGMLYKIIPFLVWFGSYSREIGRAKVPSLAEMYSERFQAIGYWAYLTGLTVTGAAILFASETGVRVGCGLLAASLGALGFNVAMILKHLFRPRVEPLSFVSSPAAHAV